MAAKKIISAPKAKSKAPAQAVSTTPVRNTSIPPRVTPAVGATASKKPAPTFEQIAVRAYSIWQSGQGGSQDDNWFRAERELRGA